LYKLAQDLFSNLFGFLMAALAEKLFFQNTNFISPNEARRYERKRTLSYLQRVENTLKSKKRKQEPLVAPNDFSEVFN